MSAKGTAAKKAQVGAGELRAVDGILVQAVDFWTSMELVLDVVVRRKEHSETLLRHSSSPRLQGRALATLGDYAAFWQAFAFLCGCYAEALGPETLAMYAWLTASEDVLQGLEALALTDRKRAGDGHSGQLAHAQPRALLGDGPQSPLRTASSGGGGGGGGV
jgi:hypothetical protein